MTISRRGAGNATRSVRMKGVVRSTRGSFFAFSKHVLRFSYTLERQILTGHLKNSKKNQNRNRAPWWFAGGRDERHEATAPREQTSTDTRIPQDKAIPKAQSILQATNVTTLPSFRYSPAADKDIKMSAGLDELLSTPTSLLVDNAFGRELALTTLGDLRSCKATVYGEDWKKR